MLMTSLIQVLEGFANIVPTCSASRMDQTTRVVHGRLGPRNVVGPFVHVVFRRSFLPRKAALFLHGPWESGWRCVVQQGRRSWMFTSQVWVS